MARLIDAQLASAWKRHVCEESPALILNGTARDARGFHLFDERLDVGAHQVELVPAVLIRRMNGYFRWRQSEDQPSVSDIDVRKAEDIAEERAIGLGVLAVDDRMSAGEQHASLSSVETQKG